MNPQYIPIAGEAQWLREYGPWAIVVVLFSVVTVLYFAYVRSRDAQSAALIEHAAEIRELNEQHKKEMGDIVNRLIETTANQVREYHALAEKITAVVDNLSRRLESPGRR